MRRIPTSSKYLIWDFDGTLAYRQGMWTQCLLDVIRQAAPDCAVTADQIRPYLQVGYPWHTPDQVHIEIKTSEQWWDTLDPLFIRIFAGVGIDASRASDMARQVRHVYPHPDHWRLYDDTIPTLDLLSSQGWKHVLLSNHVPELRAIVHHLQLDAYLTTIFNSAETGYEKPNRQAFLNVLTTIDHAEEVWMIGDSIEADIAGAAALGIPGILVRKDHAEARNCCLELLEVVDVLARLSVAK